MNKKKKTLYIMLPVIILVWGYVIMQFFSFFSGSPNYAKNTQNTVVNIDKIETDTFSIVADYRDPFLGKSSHIKHKKKYASKTTTRVKTKKNITTEKAWPSIQYKGMIKNKNSKIRVGIITINNTEHLIKEGQTIKELKVIKINKELITILYQNEKKDIEK